MPVSYAFYSFKRREWQPFMYTCETKRTGFVAFGAVGGENLPWVMHRFKVQGLHAPRCPGLQLTPFVLPELEFIQDKADPFAPPFLATATSLSPVQDADHPKVEQDLFMCPFQNSSFQGKAGPGGSKFCVRHVPP